MQPPLKAVSSDRKYLFQEAVRKRDLRLLGLSFFILRFPLWLLNILLA
jgi:hypothetical protein